MKAISVEVCIPRTSNGRSGSDADFGSGAVETPAADGAVAIGAGAVDGAGEVDEVATGGSAPGTGRSAGSGSGAGAASPGAGGAVIPATEAGESPAGSVLSADKMRISEVKR